MKILFYSSYFYPYTSGITTYLFKILSHLSKKHKITVLTFNHKENKTETETINNFTIIRMPYWFRLYKGFISPQSLYYFFTQVRKNDLIIVNLPNIEGLPLVIFGKLLRKNIISILHCLLDLGNRLTLKSIALLGNTVIILQLLFSNQVISYTLDYIKNLPANSLFRKKLKITLPPLMGLPVSKDRLNELQKLKAKKIWVGYAGRVSKEKGLEYLIEGLPKNIELVFAGPYGKQVVGENEYYLKIKQLLEKKGLKYRFLGNLNEQELGAFYKTIDVLLFPSINRTEAFGMVQAESMLQGTPVIATNLPGVRIPIKLTRMGIIVPPKNPKAINQAIKEILKNKKKYTNKKLISRAEKIFDIKKTFNFYTSLINKYEKKP